MYLRLEIVGDTTERGTRITFKADPEIFKESDHYEYEVLQARLREQAFLNAGVKIILTDSRDAENPKEDIFFL